MTNELNIQKLGLQKNSDQEKKRKKVEAYDNSSIDNNQSFSNDFPIQMKSNKTGIPNNVLSKMEYSFGTDFSDVKIHANSMSSKNLGALAYTQGKDIHFSSGQFNPNSFSGQALLGHELTHVVQQNSASISNTQQAKFSNINSESRFEMEADSAGLLAAQGKKINVKNNIITNSALVPVQCKIAMAVTKNKTSLLENNAGVVGEFIQYIDKDFKVVIDDQKTASARRTRISMYKEDFYEAKFTNNQNNTISGYIPKSDINTNLSDLLENKTLPTSSLPLDPGNLFDSAKDVISGTVAENTGQTADSLASGIERQDLKEKDGDRIVDKKEKDASSEIQKQYSDAISGVSDSVTGIFGMISSYKKGWKSSSGDKQWDEILEGIEGAGKFVGGTTKAVDATAKLYGSEAFDKAGKVGGLIGDSLASLKSFIGSFLKWWEIEQSSSQKGETRVDALIGTFEGLQSGMKVVNGFYDLFSESGIPVSTFNAVPGIGMAINLCKAIKDLYHYKVGKDNEAKMKIYEAEAYQKLETSLTPDILKKIIITETRGYYGFRETTNQINPLIHEMIADGKIAADGSLTIKKNATDTPIILTKDQIKLIKNYEYANKLREVNSERKVQKGFSSVVDLISLASDFWSLGLPTSQVYIAAIKSSISAGKLLWAGGSFIVSAAGAVTGKASSLYTAASNFLYGTPQQDTLDARAKKGIDRSEEHEHKAYIRHAKNLLDMVADLDTVTSIENQVSTKGDPTIRTEYFKKTKMIENYIKATGVDMGLLYAMNNNREEQFKLLVIAMKSR